MEPMTADPLQTQLPPAAGKHHSTDAERHEMIVERQLGRQLALQALFEIDSVGHLPGDVVDARMAHPISGGGNAAPHVLVGPAS